MRNIAALLIVLLAVSCIPTGDSKEKAKARTEKIGKITLNKAEIDKYKFEINGVELTDVKVPYGCEIVFKLRGLEGFKEVNGKVGLDAGIKGYNNKNEELFSLSDLFKEQFPNGVPVESFSDFIKLSLRLGKPLKINESYKLVFSIKDKASDAKIEITENFTMSPTKGLVYEEKGMISNGPIFYSSDKPESALSENEMAAGDTLFVYLTGIEGMTEKNNLVWPDASVKFVNEFGDVISEFKDLFKEYEKEGVSAEIVKDMISLNLMLPADLKQGKKYTGIFTIGDKKDKTKSLTAKYDFTIK